uniref:Ribonuclease H-like domain, reverse transcriptase, RNA-dependent DNA polymerase n=1 Tax=Tanacetum cinerariifolium TaxID=118510 RepID=A0A6L2N1W7_TANCI|nr:ribonuclease H-like domain, reverse transcriptase, RNA-dependent DNA polymerase [Tanacetum cinerariifolium]
MRILFAAPSMVVKRRITRGTIQISQSKVPLLRADETAFLTGDVRYGKAFPTDTSLEAGQDKENITKTSAMPHEASPRVTSLGDGACSKHEGMDQGEDLLVRDTVKDSDKSVDKGSDNTDEMADVLGTLGATNILASGGLRLVFTTASLLVGTASIVVSPSIATANESFPTATICTTASVTTPTTKVTRYSIGFVIESSSPISINIPSISKKDKEKGKMTEPEQPSKEKVLEQMSVQLARDVEAKFAQDNQIIREKAERDSEIARIHSKRELEMMITELDKSNEMVAKYLSGYKQAKAGLLHNEKVELIDELLMYQRHLAQIKKYQAQQNKPATKTERRNFYMSILRSDAGWKVKDFKGTTFEQIEEKFNPVWEKMQDFVPMNSKLESERLKRPGIQLGKESFKKLKTTEASEYIATISVNVPTADVYTAKKTPWTIKGVLRIDAQEVSDEFYGGAHYLLRVVVKTASALIEINKALLKDEEVEDVDVHLYRSMIGSLMIFRYLKGKSKLGLWYPKDSPFNLEAFLDSDYARASIDRKSTIGGCQILRKRLISWQCKKQKVVTNSTTEAEYVAAANCCGQAFANMKKEEKDFSWNVTPLFKTMMVQAPEDMGKGSEIPTDPHHHPLLHNCHPLYPKRSKNQGGNKEKKLKFLHQVVLDLEEAKTAQAKENSRLKKKVKNLEQKRKSKTLGIKRLRKVGSARSVESSTKASLGDQEDASKQGRMIDNFDQDVEVTRVDDTQGRMNEEDMFRVNDLDDDEVVVDVSVSEKVEQSVKVVEKELSIADLVTTAGEVVTTAGIEVTTAVTTPQISKDELTLAQALIEIKAAKPKAITTAATIVTAAGTRPKANGIVMPLKRKDQIMIDAKIAKDLEAQMQVELEEEERLARVKEEETNIGSSKRAANNLEQEDAKRQRIKEKNESAELKRCLEIIPEDDDDVTIKVTPLYSKSPTIVDYKIYKEGMKSFFKIIRADVASASAGTKGHIPPKTAEQKIAKKNDLKAKSTLMLAIPDEHLLKFHACKDAKSLWEAIKNRFRGNKESKKIHKTILKQNYENFAASSQEGLNKTYDSTNETVNTVHSVFAANSKDQASTASYADDVIFSFFSNKFNAP